MRALLLHPRGAGKATLARLLREQHGAQLREEERRRTEGRTGVRSVEDAVAWAAEHGYPVLAEPSNRCTGMTHLRAGREEDLRATVAEVLNRCPREGAMLSRYEED